MSVFQNCDTCTRERRLTKRELEVIVLLAHGIATKEAAWTLGISPKTMEKHIGNLMFKLNANSRYDVLVSAVKMGLHRELRWLPGTASCLVPQSIRVA